MATSMVMLVGMVVVILFLAKVETQYAQDCRVYRLKGNTENYATPSIHVQNSLAISFYNENADDIINNIHIILEGATRTEKIHINSHGDVAIQTYKQKNFTLDATCPPNSWLTLAILLQDQNIFLYKIDERDSYVWTNGSLGSNVTARVTTSRDVLHVTLNCPAGCLMHDENSPLIGREMPVGDGVNIYISHEVEATDAKLILEFMDYGGKKSMVNVDITQYEPSLWHQVAIIHDKEKSIIVTINGADFKGKVIMAEENVTFAIRMATSVLWSLHCHHALEDQKGWGQRNDTDPTMPLSKDDGAGIGEVLAWVLAGMALFMVMVMALLLCTKMGPRTDAVDYGASIGVVTSFGRQITFRNVEREAEEDTEPDSPTFLSSSIHHKVPEEEDEHQSTTKML